MTTFDLLKRLVSIPSVYPHEKQISKFISDYLEELGFLVKIVKTRRMRPNIVATFGKSSSYLGFYGHMDTVARDENGKYQPYELVSKSGKVYGLGVEDMKGGIAAILKACEFAAFKKLPVMAIFGVDEENISEGAHDLVDSGFLSNISFLISAESGQVRDYSKPFNVCYGRNGRALFDITVFGKKAHAAESDKGVNAIESASFLIQQIKKIKFRKHKYLGETVLSLHSIVSDAGSFSIPSICHMQYSLLSTPLVSEEKFVEKVNAIAKRFSINLDIKLHVRKTPYGKSYEVDRKNPFLKNIEKEVFNRHGVSPIYTRSVADENIFANRLKIPVISLGPIGGGGHTKDEWLDVASLNTVEKVYKDIILLYNN